jgi:hypothetical protein
MSVCRETAAVDAVQHQALQLDVEVGGRAEALDQRHGTVVTFRHNNGLARSGSTVKAPSGLRLDAATGL